MCRCFPLTSIKISVSQQSLLSGFNYIYIIHCHRSLYAVYFNTQRITEPSDDIAYSRFPVF